MADEVPNLPPGATVTRSTAMNEWTFMVALLLVVVIIFTLIWALVHLHEPHGLSIMIWIMGGILALCVAAVASPWIGTIKFTAGASGVTGEIEGEGEHKS